MSAVDPEERRTLIARARFGRKTKVSAPTALAVTSHPLITRVAVDTLRSGGNACDAVLAASVAQTVVEPHMSTITGVFSQLYFDAEVGDFTYVNGSAAAPRAPLPGFSPADLLRGRGVAVPGFWAGWEAALERHGSRPRAELLAPAITLARDGFEVYPFLYGVLFEQVAPLGRTPEGREMFFPDGAMLVPGDQLRQRPLADTLEQLADKGGDYFYRGAFAQRLVDGVAGIGGVLTRQDLDEYEARWSPPARGTYRDHEVVASPPPDQGGAHLIEMLNMVELLDLAAMGPPTESVETLYQLIRIHDEVYASGARQRDPRSHPLPLETILSKEYARLRFELLQMGAPKEPAAAVYPGSNHLTVVDPAGNVATVLHSCMSMPWSNGLFVDGVSVAAAGAHFLRVMPKPGDRISSIVVPNMVCSNGRPLLASGSPSQSLLACVLQNVVNMVDFGIDIEESVHRPRFGGPSLSSMLMGGPPATMIEADIDPAIRDEVAKRGVPTDIVNPWNYLCGSFEAVVIDPVTGVRSGCGDPRRNTTVEGI